MSATQLHKLKSAITVSRRYFRMRAGLMFGLCAALGWGGYLAATRHAVAEGLTSNDLAFIRYTTAGIILGPWLLLHWRDRCSGLSLSRSLILALLAGPPLVMLVAGGSRHAPFATGMLVELAVLAVVGILLATWWLGERLDAIRVAGLVALTVRIIVVAGPVFLCCTSRSWMGVIMYAGAGCMFAAFVALVEKWQIEPLAATAVVSVMSACTFGPYYLGVDGLGRLSGMSLWLLGEQVVGQGLVAGVVALTAFSLCVRLEGIVRAMLFPALTPAAGVLFGSGLTGELPTITQASFLALSALGALFLLAASRQPRTMA